VGVRFKISGHEKRSRRFNPTTFLTSWATLNMVGVSFFVVTIFRCKTLLDARLKRKSNCAAMAVDMV